jgi:peptidoglycan/LPS O-acetylase OafA/YrhL
VLLGLAMREGWRPRWALGHAAILGGISYAAAAVVATPLFHSPHRPERAMANLLVDLFVLVPVVMLIAATVALDLSGRRTWLAHPRTVALGDSSFALYLIHPMLVLLVPRLFPGTGRFTALGIPMWFATVAVCLTAAGLLHYRVEKPLERRIRGWFNRREATRA